MEKGWLLDMLYSIFTCHYLCLLPPLNIMPLRKNFIFFLSLRKYLALSPNEIHLWVWWPDSEARKEPKKLGKGPHDCALVALYAAVPGISEDDAIDAFPTIVFV